MEPPRIDWIDFLLDESLLLPYLKTKPKSVIVELLESFIDNISNAGEDVGTENGIEASHLRKKARLKTLAFRTAAFLNWNLDNFAEMNIESQFLLMTYINEAFGNKCIFCRTIYYRWMLKSRALESGSNPVARVSNEGLFVLFKDLADMTTELERSATIDETDAIDIPMFASILHGNSLDYMADLCYMHITDFLPILYYDLGVFALCSEMVQDYVAVEYFRKLRSFEEVGIESCPHFSIPSAKLAGYLKLLGIMDVTGPEKEILKSLSSYSGQDEEMIIACATPMGDSTLPILTPRKVRIERNPSDAKFGLIEELMKTSDPAAMESIVRNIIASPNIPQGPISRFFPNPPIPDALNLAISELGPGHFQDVLFIRILNGLRLLEMKCFNGFRYSLEMAQLTIRDRHGTSYNFHNRRMIALLRELDTLIGWEILHGDIQRAFLNWGGPEILCVDELVERCEDCIKIFQSPRSDVRPRRDVVEAGLMALMNLGRFELVVNSTKVRRGWPFLEFLALLGRVCINVQNGTFYSSNFRDVFNAVLPILSVSTEVSRQPRAEGIVANTTALKWLLDRSKSANLVKIFVSLLAKLHNFVTRDDSGFTIDVDLLEQWPNFLDEVCDGPSTGFSSVRKVSGTSKLNLVLIRELLVNFLETQRGPDELMWLKTAGHVHLIANRPGVAMKCYVDYWCRSTDCFESESSRCWNDDLLIHRMIRASYQLGVYLQATILCQFLTVADYTTAFGMAGETCTSEAWVSLSEYLWDQTILEYIINFYSKRMEYGYRLNAAMKMMRQLELNAHNNEEIKEAAIRVRKIRFLRTLVSIYLMN